MSSGVNKDSSKVTAPWAVTAVRPSAWREKGNSLHELRGGFRYFCGRESFSRMLWEHPWKVGERRDSLREGQVGRRRQRVLAKKGSFKNSLAGFFVRKNQASLTRAGPRT